jgi:hypothetical protein
MSNVADDQEPANPGGLSSREEIIVSDLVQKIDFGHLLHQDHVEAEVPIRDKLKAAYRSSRSGDAFAVEEYLNQQKSTSATMEYSHRVIWSLANSLVSINGQPFMPGAKAEHLSAKIQRLLEKPKIIVDQLIWGQALFEEAVRRVCEDPEHLRDTIKKS